jgi:hypothetical protein
LPAGVSRALRTSVLRRGCWRNALLARARNFPKLAGDLDRIDAGLLPPGFLVGRPMNCPVMRPAERNSEFIAGFAT